MSNPNSKIRSCSAKIAYIVIMHEQALEKKMDKTKVLHEQVIQNLFDRNNQVREETLKEFVEFKFYELCNEDIFKRKIKLLIRILNTDESPNMLYLASKYIGNMRQYHDSTTAHLIKELGARSADYYKNKNYFQKHVFKNKKIVQALINALKRITTNAESLSVRSKFIKQQREELKRGYGTDRAIEFWSYSLDPRISEKSLEKLDVMSKAQRKIVNTLINVTKHNEEISMMELDYKVWVKWLANQWKW